MYDATKYRKNSYYPPSHTSSHIPVTRYKSKCNNSLLFASYQDALSHDQGQDPQPKKINTKLHENLVDHEQCLWHHTYSNTSI